MKEGSLLSEAHTVKLTTQPLLMKTQLKVFHMKVDGYRYSTLKIRSSTQRLFC